MVERKVFDPLVRAGEGEGEGEGDGGVKNIVNKSALSSTQKEKTLFISM